MMIKHVMSYRGFAFLYISNAVFIAIIKADRSSVKSVDMQNDDITFCQTNYPFSYSKCLRMCSSNPGQEPTCIDDDLCVCDIYNQSLLISDKNQTTEHKFGVDSTVQCEPRQFCEESCRNTVAPQSGQVYRNGVICAQTTKDYGFIKMCVCKL